MFKKTSTTLLLALVAIHAAASDDAAAQEPDAISVRAEAQQLEQQMYTVFNELNSSDDFDVTCSEKKVTGSLIPEWSCDAAFMRNAEAQGSAGRFDNPSNGGTGTLSRYEPVPQSKAQVSRKTRKKTEELNAEMMSLARQHPELASAMIAYNNKRLQLEALEK